MSNEKKTKMHTGELIVAKPWGSYTDIHRSKEVVFKKIIVTPQKRISLQTHNMRDECWFVASGSGKMEVGTEVWFVRRGCSFFIKKRVKHRIENTGKEDLVIYEMQMGECSEDDIVRYEDDFGRGV